MKVTDWEQYIKEQEKLSLEAKQQLQHLISASGIPISQLQSLAQVDLSVVDPELLQKLEVSTGVKLSSLQTEKPTKNVSSYRLRGKGISV